MPSLLPKWHSSRRSPALPKWGNIVFSDANGEVVHVADLGPQGRGLTGFSWENIPEEIAAGDAPLRIEAYADSGQGMQSVSSSVFAEVLAASTADPVRGVVLDVRDYGEIAAADISRFRK
jgi:flagellar basal-body rod modification protein FlgD